MNKSNTRIIKNIDKLVTMAGSNKPRIKEEMKNIEILENAYVVIKDGLVAEVGVGDVYLENFSECENIEDKSGYLVTPGLIDAHTHLVHGGSRENEFTKKLSGMSYIDILKSGGGIISTVKHTIDSTQQELYNKAKKSLDRMLEFGVTTVESKSGYGLNLETEIKQLEVGKKLNENHPVDLVHTFLGAHAIPPKYKDNPDQYIKIIIEEMLPIVKYKKLAEFCDVFCEDSVFSIQQSEQILQKAKELGYKLKIHADEIVSLGGAELAARLRCTSADHLMAASDLGIEMMAKNNVIANLLPATSFNLKKNYANARKMIDSGVALAISSDYNPGSCPSENLQFVMQLGCLELNMTPEEVLTSVTINAAHAIDRANIIGSIEVGKKADLVIFDAPNIEYLMYHFGINHVESVIKDGIDVVKNRQRVLN